MSAARLVVSRHVTSDGVSVLKLAGEIDFNTAVGFREALADRDGALGHRTVVDFREVTFMDSSGINVLVAANRAAGEGGGWVRLSSLPAAVHDVLRIVGLDEVLCLYPTLDHALEISPPPS
ncbi:STAS domain-containing protein [Streptomyces sp. NPDC058274]|uniref:STAS domain-containing protein n=1 Tax=Streptomyces sp. NPDC058274 TaxID=3346416 RepID=UPI0036F0F0C9